MPSSSTGTGTAAGADADAHAPSAENVSFPKFTGGPSISLPPEDLRQKTITDSQNQNGVSRPSLSTIHSGTSTPARSATPPPQASDYTGSRSNSLSWSTSSMPEQGGGRRGRMPPMQRNASILDDLKAKGAGIPPTMAPLTPGTAELELGTNPFENATLTSAAPTPGPVTPSLQSSIASARRPAGGSRLGGGESTAPQNALNQALKDRLNRLHSTATGTRRSETWTETTQRTGRTPGALPPGSGVSQAPEPTTETAGSYFSLDPGATSPSITQPTSGPATSMAHRRRSSSNARHGSISGVEKPGLNRAFTRSRRTTDARRRSSSSVDGAHAFSPRSPGEPPSFTFEHNPHGNGGLQNAIRSVSDSNLRTASEPTRATIDAGTETRSRQMPAPTAKTVMGEHIWIGTPGCSIADFDAPLRDSIEKRYLQDKHSSVVWVEDDVLEPAYDMFCKQILWPTFHYQVLDAHKSKAYESPSWLDYKAMNQAFADRIVAVYKPGDLSEYSASFKIRIHQC